MTRPTLTANAASGVSRPGPIAFGYASLARADREERLRKAAGSTLINDMRFRLRRKAFAPPSISGIWSTPTRQQPATANVAISVGIA